MTEVIKDGTDLPFGISQDLLELCEELCIAPSAWDAYPDSTQKAIQDVFLDSIGVEGKLWVPSQGESTCSHEAELPILPAFRDAFIPYLIPANNALTAGIG